MSRLGFLFTVIVSASLLGAQTSSPSLTIYCEVSPPYQFINSEGKLDGLGVEIVREIQRRVKNNDPILVIPWARGYKIALEKPNTLLFSTARTALRDPLFQWIGPISEASYGFYARKGASIVIKSLDDARTVKNISVYLNDIRDTFLTDAGFDNLYRTQEEVTTFKQLLMGRVELAAGEIDSIDSIIASAGGTVSDIKLLYKFLSVSVYIAASRGTKPETVRVWNDAIAAMNADGTMRRITKKFFPGRVPPGPDTAIY